jgi:hypothetical protein
MADGGFCTAATGGLGGAALGIDGEPAGMPTGLIALALVTAGYEGLAFSSSGGACSTCTASIMRCVSKGFRTCPSAPQASYRASSSRSKGPVMIHTGMSLRSASPLTCLHRSYPEMSPKRESVMMRSGCLFRAVWRTSAPLPAVMISTSSMPRKVSSNAFLMVAESSATRTVFGTFASFSSSDRSGAACASFTTRSPPMRGNPSSDGTSQGIFIVPLPPKSQ